MMAPCRVRGLGLIPISLIFSLLITIGISYLIAVLNGDVAVLFPYISDTGGKPPESCVFAQFVNLSSLLLLALIYVRYKEVDTIEGLPPQQVACLNRAGFFAGLLSTLGLSIVGNFQDTNVLSVHVIGALMLFIAATVYAVIHTRISFLLCPEYSGIVIWRLRLFLSALMIVSLVTCLVFEGVASIQWRNHHNSSDTVFHWKPTDGGYTFHVASAAFEWVLALTFGVYCLSFYGGFCEVSLGLNMFLHVEPFPAITGDDTNTNAEPNEYTHLYA